jgi:hypothetical protein
MTSVKEVVIRTAKGNEDFIPRPGSITLDEGAFYVKIQDSDCDIAIPLEPVLVLLKEQLLGDGS